jgi:hypothetical protein
VTSTPSCQRSPQLDDVPDLVGEATGEAGLAGTDITAVRVLWCRQKGREGETAIALTTRRGPDIQCYEAVEETAGGARRTGSQCWPVARGTGATAPFLAPDAAPDGSGEILALTAFAPGASTLELHVGAPDSAPLARASVAADGYARMDIRTRAATPRDYLESQAYVSLLDRRGGAVDFVEVSSRSRVDVWGEGTDGPVVP